MQHNSTASLEIPSDRKCDIDIYRHADIESASAQSMARS